MKPLPAEIDVDSTDEDIIRKIRTQRIREGTLSDKECIIELHERKAVFLNDPDWLPECRKYGETIFNQAIDRDVEVALRTGQRVVGVLHLVLVHIGGLYLDNKRLKAEIAARGSAESAAHVGFIAEGVAREGEWTGLANDEIESESESEADVVITSSDVEVEDDTSSNSLRGEECKNLSKAVAGEDAQTARLNAAITARRKRRQLTHGASRIDESSTSRRSQSHISATWGEADITSIPSPPGQLLSPAQATSNASKEKDLEPPRPQKSIITASPERSLVQSPSLTSQTSLSIEGHMQKSSNLKDASKQSAPTSRSRKRLLRSIDPPATLFVGGPGNKQGHNRRSVLRAQQPKHAAAVNKPEPPRKKQKIVKLKVSKQIPRRTSTRQQTKSTRSRLEISDSEASNTDSDNDNDNDIEVRNPPSKPKPRTHSPPHATSPKPTPQNPLPTFPPLPRMPARDHAPFLKGAEIALDNILSDHLEDRDVSLLELIEEVEDNQPRVEDWERKTIVKGGEWVCGVLRGCVENGEGEDVERLVGGLGRWVDAGLGGR